MRRGPETPTAPVETVMTSPGVMILEDIPMVEAHDLAVRYDYNSFPVVTPTGRLVGMMTGRDLLCALRAGLKDQRVWREPVWRWMAHGVLALRPKDSLEAALALMADSGSGSLPVIDGEAHVVGMVARRDLMAALSGMPLS